MRSAATWVLSSWSCDLFPGALYLGLSLLYLGMLTYIFNPPMMILSSCFAKWWVSFESDKFVPPSINVPSVGYEDFPHIAALSEMMPQLLLRGIVWKSSEVKGWYIFFIPQVWNVVLLVSSCVAWAYPSEVPLRARSTSLYWLVFKPNSLPPNVSLSLSPSPSRSLSLDLISLSIVNDLCSNL